MASIVIEKTDLTYRATDTFGVIVTDADGQPVDLGAVGAKFGMAMARNFHPNTPRILQKLLDGPDVEPDPGQANRAIVTFRTADYDGGQLNPRSDGYAATIWYQSPEGGDEAVAHVRFMVHGSVAIEWNGE
jgi:hypothetical protein